MLDSVRIEEAMMELLSDGKNHVVQDIKGYLDELNLGEYSEEKFVGSLDKLQNNGKIVRIGI